MSLGCKICDGYLFGVPSELYYTDRSSIKVVVIEDSNMDLGHTGRQEFFFFWRVGVWGGGGGGWCQSSNSTLLDRVWRENLGQAWSLGGSDMMYVCRSKIKG